MRAARIAAALIALWGCSRAAPVPRLPPDSALLSEPQGLIDPISAEAAGQVVQHYAALIEQKRFAEARSRWTSLEGASRFETQLRRFREVHMEIGAPGRLEGAAGSVFVRIPTIFYGRLNSGEGFRRAANVTLRRANNVPGSTAQQRRWRIERIAWVSAR